MGSVSQGFQFDPDTGSTPSCFSQRGVRVDGAEGVREVEKALGEAMQGLLEPDLAHPQIYVSSLQSPNSAPHFFEIEIIIPMTATTA